MDGNSLDGLCTGDLLAVRQIAFDNITRDEVPPPLLISEVDEFVPETQRVNLRTGWETDRFR